MKPEDSASSKPEGHTCGPAKSALHALVRVVVGCEEIVRSHRGDGQSMIEPYLESDARLESERRSGRVAYATRRERAGRIRRTYQEVHKGAQTGFGPGGKVVQAPHVGRLLQVVGYRWSQAIERLYVAGLGDSSIEGDCQMRRERQLQLQSAPVLPVAV